MTEIEILDFIPSVMSALAAIAAAYAAFLALGVSRKANALNEKSILTVHHQAATLELSRATEVVANSSKNFRKLIYDLHSSWPKEIGTKDDRFKGGTDPRPLRHVVANGCEMLANHGLSNRSGYDNIQYSMFSIVRNGFYGSNENEYEYESLLRIADGTGSDFENTFGFPEPNKEIIESKAFRWVCYQLDKRVSNENWEQIWGDAWMVDGWLHRYCEEFSKIRPVLQQALNSLKQEKNNIEHSALPLSSNPQLKNKYKKALSKLEFVLEHSDLEIMEFYKDSESDFFHLILYSMGIAYLTGETLEYFISGSEV